MKELIQVTQEKVIMCDNPECDFEYSYEGKSEKLLLAFVNMPCPKCGEVLLTPQDYLENERLLKHVARINKWFGWIAYFIPKSRPTSSVEVRIHNGVNIATKSEPKS